MWDSLPSTALEFNVNGVESNSKEMVHKHHGSLDESGQQPDWFGYAFAAEFEVFEAASL